MESNIPFRSEKIWVILLAAAICFGCSDQKKTDEIDASNLRTNKGPSLQNQKRVLQSRVIETPPAEKPPPDPKQTVDAFRQRLQAIAGKTYPSDNELKTKAESGDVASQVQLAKNLLNGGEEAEALKWFQKAADAGNATAQHDLAAMYVFGRGVEQDFPKAIELFTKAANQGDMDSQYSLGLRYVRGDHVQKDFAEAAKWFGLAANQGSADAQASLARRYAAGEGVPEDKVAAYKWYQLADKGGHYNAGQMRDKLAESMTPDEIRRGQSEATAFVPVKTGK